MRLKKGAEKLLFTTLLLACITAPRCEDKSFPLDLAAAFPPVICGGDVYIFGAGGRNQTLSPKDEAPSCNLFPLYPAVAPVCADGRLYVADASGAFYEMSERVPQELLRLPEKPLALFAVANGPVVVTQKKVMAPGVPEVAIPFSASAAFQSGNALLIFGEKEGAVYSEGKLSATWALREGPVRTACLAGRQIIAGTDKAVLFLDGATGRLKNRFTTKSEVVALVPSDGGTVAAASKDHMVRLLDPKGKVLWQQRIEGRPLGLWPHPRGFVTATAGGKDLILMEKKKGTEVWRHTLKSGELVIPPCFTASTAALFSFEGAPEPVLHLVELPQ